MTLKNSFILILVLFLSNCNSNKGFTIIEIEESNPIYPNQIYTFPILESNSFVSKKINTSLIKDFLDLENNKDHKSIFENVWSSKENQIPRLSFVEYNINLLNRKIYSVTFNSEGCGAYCEEFSISYNFNLSDGKKISLEDILTQKGENELLKLLTNHKRKVIEDYLIKLKNEKTSDENQKYTNQTIELYKYCLEELPFKSLKFVDFKIEKDNISIVSSRCSNHAMRALDELGNYEYTLERAKMKDLLNNYGKELLK